VGVRDKVFSHAVAVDRLGVISAEQGEPLALGEEWTPEHLVLAALVRCSIKSLRYHAGRAGLELLAAGSAASTVRKREEDGRYAMVEVEVEIAVELAHEHEPEAPGLDELLAKAERDCFIGASLTSKPAYRWTINGSRRR
jgi:organic hydroperoxide reductase OsmC/OhrA